MMADRNRLIEYHIQEKSENNIFKCEDLKMTKVEEMKDST